MGTFASTVIMALNKSDDSKYSNGKMVAMKKNLFEVERVIGHREVQRGSKTIAEYLVLWMGYPHEDASWQPWTNLKSCVQLLHDYHDRMLSRRFPPPPPSHRMKLRKTDSNNSKSTTTSIQMTPLSSENSPEWEVEAILAHESLNHTTDGKKMHYLVKWIDITDPIWTEESRAREFDSKQILQAYVNNKVPSGEMLRPESNMKSTRDYIEINEE